MKMVRAIVEKENTSDRLYLRNDPLASFTRSDALYSAQFHAGDEVVVILRSDFERLLGTGGQRRRT